tara:strand:+ start:379 stop:1239 length:861 start_codon:yes stop_codon:yes gene_type:complete
MAQTDNLQDSSPDVKEAVTGKASEGLNDPGAFFGQLDQMANGLITEETPSQQTTSQEASPTENTTNSGGEDLKTLEKRYSDSSREAKRLNKRNQELEQYAPLLDKMREDPNLISTIRDYIQGQGKQGIKERMGLDEDFVFDSDEAFSDPKSDSAKVFDNIVNQKVSQIVNGKLSQEKQQNAIQQQASEFRQRHNMDDEQFEEFMNFATSRPLTYDDIFYLMNRENRDSNIANETRKEVASQMQNVRQKPQSLAGAGAASVDNEQKVEDAIFDTMLNEGLDNLFGNK